MLGTGVSLEVQRVFEGLLVNGVDMRPLYHPEGIVATVPHARSIGTQVPASEKGSICHSRLAFDRLGEHALVEREAHGVLSRRIR
eukprot:617848-Rhodomonas_salina.1